jgi:tetratricopeptide (TPR) repeat protein
MSRDHVRRRVAGCLLAAAVLVGSPALAGGPGAEAFQEAHELHGDERWDEAAARWIAAHQAGYREEVSAYNAACALARAGKHDLALQWLQRADELGFDLDDYLDEDRDLRTLRADPRFAALRQKVLGGRTSRSEREAQAVLRRYQALRAGNADAGQHDGIGRELLRVGRYEEAAQAFETAAAHEDEPATSLYNAACARSLQGQRSRALDLLLRAVEQGFADPEHLDKDDDLDPIRGDPRFQEIRMLAAELEVPGYPSDAYQRYGKVQREWRAALPRIEAAVKKYPHLGQTWFNLGFAAFTLGRGDKAIRPFEKAVELGYRKVSSMYNLACAHAIAGHVDQAFAWLDKAMAAGFDSWWLIRQDADLDNVRYDPRFRKYLDLARAKQAHDWN